MYRILLFGLSLVSLSLQAQVKFTELTWEEALEKAQKEKKLVFVSAIATWSEPCELLKKYTLSDLEVANFYNANFINVELDVENYPGIELAEAYNITIYPSMLFLNDDAEVVHRGCGAVEAGELLDLGKQALGTENLQSSQKRLAQNEGDKSLLMNYLDLLDQSCLNAEKFAQDYLSKTKQKDLLSETNFAIIEGYQWNVYSREFQYLLDNLIDFEAAHGKQRVHRKIYNTYLSQYQEIFEAEELHLFSMRALLKEVNGKPFIGSDTLLTMMNLHYNELTENWDAYASSAIEWIGMTDLTDIEELNDIAWKFYLFVDDPRKLELAANWAKSIVDVEPTPSAIDTYASLLFKQGERKKAIELEKQAIELAQNLFEDTEHYEYQLKKFQQK